MGILNFLDQLTTGVSCRKWERGYRIVQALQLNGPLIIFYNDKLLPHGLRYYRSTAVLVSRTQTGLGHFPSVGLFSPVSHCPAASKQRLPSRIFIQCQKLYSVGVFRGFPPLSSTEHCSVFSLHFPEDSVLVVLNSALAFLSLAGASPLGSHTCLWISSDLPPLAAPVLSILSSTEASLPLGTSYSVQYGL